MKLSLRDVLVLVCWVACRDGLAPGNDRPDVSNVTVAANPTNVLSAIVTCSGGGVDSVRVRFAGSDGDTGAAPVARPTAGRARIVLLGLQPSARYSLAVEALGPGGSASMTDSVATAALPSAIQSLHLRG